MLRFHVIYYFETDNGEKKESIAMELKPNCEETNNACEVEDDHG